MWIFFFLLSSGSILAQQICKPVFPPGVKRTTGKAPSLNSFWIDPLVWYNPIQESLQKASRNFEEEVLRTRIQNFAFRFIGRPYRSSGKSPSTGFDCSGFTGYIYQNFGLRLKASSTAQAMEGKKIAVKEATIGDLAFFGKRGRRGKGLVNHAAIVISKPGEPLAIIHSASNKGIVITKVEECRYWKNSLLFVRNVL
jgi:hypothetical protein